MYAADSFAHLYEATVTGVEGANMLNTCTCVCMFWTLYVQ